MPGECLLLACRACRASSRQTLQILALYGGPEQMATIHSAEALMESQLLADKVNLPPYALSWTTGRGSVGSAVWAPHSPQAVTRTPEHPSSSTQGHLFKWNNGWRETPPSPAHIQPKSCHEQGSSRFNIFTSKKSIHARQFPPVGNAAVTVAMPFLTSLIQYNSKYCVCVSEWVSVSVCVCMCKRPLLLFWSTTSASFICKSAYWRDELNYNKNTCKISIRVKHESWQQTFDLIPLHSGRSSQQRCEKPERRLFKDPTPSVCWAGGN